MTAGEKDLTRHHQFGHRIALLLPLSLILLCGALWFAFRVTQLEWMSQGQTDIVFEESLLDWRNRTDVTDKTGSLPFMAGVVIDVDSDGYDELVLGGGRDQDDHLFGYSLIMDRFVDRSHQHTLVKAKGDATMGGTSVDLDRDGYPELLLVRESGLWIFPNDRGALREPYLAFAPDKKDRTTLLSVAAGDIDKDGIADLYLSGYIRNSDVEGQTIFSRPYGGYCYLLAGRPDRSFSDVSEEWGLRRQHNTFTALFADFDSDGDSDLIVAEDTGQIETWRNDGSPPFTQVPNPSVFSYPMGLAAGDFNGDGNLDFYASNAGPTLPQQMLRGDLPSDARFNPDYMLFAGDGTGSFTDIATAMKAARIGFGWGVVAADFNLDGWEDIAVAQNYAKLNSPLMVPRYTGKILQNEQGNRFRPVEKRSGATNRYFAIAPLIGDFDGDARPDLVWANLNGPARAFLNRTERTNAIVVRLDDSVGSYGATIRVGLEDRMLARRFVPSQGLCSDQSAKIIIGLGSSISAKDVSIDYQDGKHRSFGPVAAGDVIDARRDRP
jgi:enediyne biosynthesis protein E4